MQKRTITVLGHQVEYTADVVMDEEMLNEVHDTIREQIISGEWILTEHKGDTVEMFCEGDDNWPYTPTTVTWKIVNKADKWKEIAGNMYEWLSMYIETRPTEDSSHPVHEILKQYEQLIKEEDADNR